jgi:hypothetical protein
MRTFEVRVYTLRTKERSISASRKFIPVDDSHTFNKFSAQPSERKKSR